MARTRGRNRFAEAARRVESSSASELVCIDNDILTRALALYEQHADKTWGLVDCASFVVMRDRGLSEAFTNDQHFEQAGFRCRLAMT